MARTLSDAVVVITGASSGIGRATALAFAERGSSLVLGARRQAALEEVVEECRQLGAHALAVPLDVTDEPSVRDLAGRAIENHGRIDVWVNNAAVTLFGRFEETPSDVFRRVIETNLFGYVHGARAALPYFREQGTGVLVNVGSIVAYASQPYTSAYVASKFAIRGLSNCLRMELLLDDASDIHVCSVLPATIDTPLFQQGANYCGRAARAMDPVLAAESVAAAIVGVAQRPRREVIVGNFGRLMAAYSKYLPGLYEQMAAPQIDREHLQDQPADPTLGNLFEPMPQYASVSGGWRADGGIGIGKLLLAGLAFAVPALLRWDRRNGQAAREAPQRWPATVG